MINHRNFLKAACAINIRVEVKRRGIYFLLQNNEIVYVGKTEDYLRRVPQHTYDKQFDDAFFVPCELDPLGQYELACIRLLQPKLNNNSDRRVADNAPEWDLRLMIDLLGSPATRLLVARIKRDSDRRARIGGINRGTEGHLMTLQTNHSPLKSST
jgi:hypothetical protein